MVKLIYILLLVGLVGRCNKIQQPTKGNIANYMELTVVPSKDTISIGDKLTLTFIFKNITDYPVILYPKALIQVNRSPHGFTELPTSNILHIVQNFEQWNKIKSFGSYIETYKVPILLTSSYNSPEEAFNDSSYREVLMPITRFSKEKDTRQKSLKVPTFRIFKKGENILFGSYYIEKPEKEFNKNILLYGNLKSKKFKVFVK